MAGTVVVVADYLPVLNRVRAALLHAGYRVLSSTHLPAGFPLVRLYLPDAVVLLERLGSTGAVDAVLQDLTGDRATQNIPVVLLGRQNDEACAERGHHVTPIDAFDTTALLHTIEGELQRKAAILVGGAA